MKLFQNVVGNMPGGAGFAKQKDRNISVSAPCLSDKLSQINDGGAFIAIFVDLFVVDRNNKSRSARRLVCHHTDVDISKATDDFHVLLFECLGKRPDTKPTG